VWENIRSELLRGVVSIAEALADGLVGDDYRARTLEACPRSGHANFVGQGQLVINCVMPNGFQQYLPCFELAVNIGWLDQDDAADIIRCVISDPNSPLPFLPYMEEAAKVARTVYFKRNENYTLDHVAMCVLADMVEEEVGGGVITQHLRENKPRYRGDWVVDLLM
jgi:hypothetical protein